MQATKPVRPSSLRAFCVAHDPFAQGRVLERLFGRAVFLLRDDLSTLAETQVLLGETVRASHVGGAAPYFSHGPVLDSGLAGLS